ncbi:MAG: hypothetical protein IT427_19795, partial [Pirellulales bacterium]|nr:hypothetical protein [Pirellulales bacterium]
IGEDNFLTPLLGTTCATADVGQCDRWPRWSVQAESIFLWRDNGARAQRPSPINNLSTGSAPFDVGIGPQVSLAYRVDAAKFWEAKYFSVLGMSGSAIGMDLLALDSLDPIPPNPADSLFQINRPFQLLRIDTRIQYDSEFHDAEINYLHRWGELSLLSGFRFVRLAESFCESGAFSRFTRNTNNDLFGGQFGARWCRSYHNLVSWDVTGKAGVFGNSAQQSQSRRMPSGEIPPTWTDAVVAFVGDLNFSANYRLSPVWNIRCGYNLIWLDGIALAPDQPFMLTNGRVVADGNIFLHGANVGLEADW